MDGRGDTEGQQPWRGELGAQIHPPRVHAELLIPRIRGKEPRFYRHSLVTRDLVIVNAAPKRTLDNGGNKVAVVYCL